jgi:hypothetical protein
MMDHDGDGLREYAEKFASDPGKQNGLYWATKEGENPSPLGELLVKAKAEGYSKKGSKGNPVPYHGYYYKILRAQDKNAPGGAYDYIINGNMIGGFAVVAWPAKYGNSGVVTFIVNHDGVVYQKDLGLNTEETAKAMKKFDPDKTWEREVFSLSSDRAIVKRGDSRLSLENCTLPLRSGHSAGYISRDWIRPSAFLGTEIRTCRISR